MENKEFLPHTSELLVGTCPDWMSIPTSFSVDIVGKEVLKIEAIVEVLEVCMCIFLRGLPWLILKVVGFGVLIAEKDAWHD